MKPTPDLHLKPAAPLSEGWGPPLLVLLCLLFVSFCSCSGTPEELSAKHTKRGNEYVQKEKYREAVIEYKNAVKAKPDDGTLHWKLAQALLEAKDIRNA